MGLQFFDIQLNLFRSYAKIFHRQDWSSTARQNSKSFFESAALHYMWKVKIKIFQLLNFTILSNALKWSSSFGSDFNKVFFVTKKAARIQHFTELAPKLYQNQCLSQNI